MRVGIVSDSHGDLYMLNRVLEELTDIDALIHLGDHYEDIITINNKYNKKIIYVAGNNDRLGEENLEEKVITIEGHRILLTHGDKYGVYYDLNKLYYRAQEAECSLVLYGHTHRQHYEVIENTTFFNPGSAAYPRDIGIGYGILDINSKEFTIYPCRM
ncbi:MAG: metallophosphoesterase [Clostridium sp.]